MPTLLAQLKSNYTSFPYLGDGLPAPPALPPISAAAPEPSSPAAPAAAGAASVASADGTPSKPVGSGAAALPSGAYDVPEPSSFPSTAVAGIILAILAVAGVFIFLARRNRKAQAGAAGVDYSALSLAERSGRAPPEQVRPASHDGLPGLCALSPMICPCQSCRARALLAQAHTC